MTVPGAARAAKVALGLQRRHSRTRNTGATRNVRFGMVASSSEFQTKILRRSAVADEYKLYRAALEWDLTDPIVIETRKDLISEKRWRNHLQPYHHQVTNLITFCRRLPVTLLADDVGLGKTISAGLIASELIARARISKILIVCPKLLGPQWQDELKTKFDIPALVAAGKKLIKAEPEGVGAVITTYASARLHLDKIPEIVFRCWSLMRRISFATFTGSIRRRRSRCASRTHSKSVVFDMS